MKWLRRYRYYIFLVLAIIFVRGYMLESYIITSGSMASELRTGDYVMVSKLRYGPRIPRAWKIPFINYENPLLQASVLPAAITLHDKDLRVWSGSISRNDIIAFDPPDKEPAVSSLYVSYIKRCVGVPGDKIEIREGELLVNGKLAEVPYVQTYHAYYRSALNIPTEIDYVDKRLNLVELKTAKTKLDALVEQGVITSFYPILQPAGFNDLDVFPNSHSVISNQDNIPEFEIPYEGFTIPLNANMMAWYGECIHLYEEKSIEKDPSNPGKYLVDGEAADSFTFGQNYYWAIGDNWDNSIDSRWWGLFPERNIIGKASFVWFSKNNGIRWDRILKKL